VVDLSPHLVLTSLEPLLTSGLDEPAVEACRTLSNLLRGGGRALRAALEAAPTGRVVLAALAALLGHPSWEVVAAVAGVLVNVAGDPTGRGGAALLQVRHCLGPPTTRSLVQEGPRGMHAPSRTLSHHLTITYTKPYAHRRTARPLLERCWAARATRRRLKTRLTG
jgi:hypothetical protein